VYTEIAENIIDEMHENKININIEFLGIMKKKISNRNENISLTKFFFTVKKIRKYSGRITTIKRKINKISMDIKLACELYTTIHIKYS
jgi:hypothetical protein